jgi:hypothetical protein
VSSVPQTPDPALDVFVSAAKAAAGYAATATANLQQFSAREQALPSKFDPAAMQAAWARQSGEQVSHWVLFSGTEDKKLRPLSLDMLWEIHTSIVYFNAVVELGRVTSEW